MSRIKIRRPKVRTFLRWRSTIARENGQSAKRPGSTASSFAMIRSTWGASQELREHRNAVTSEVDHVPMPVTAGVESRVGAHKVPPQVSCVPKKRCKSFFSRGVLTLGAKKPAEDRVTAAWRGESCLCARRHSTGACVEEIRRVWLRVSSFTSEKKNSETGSVSAQKLASLRRCRCFKSELQGRF